MVGGGKDSPAFRKSNVSSVGALGGRTPSASGGPSPCSGLIPCAGASQQQSVSGWGVGACPGPVVKERDAGPGPWLWRDPPRWRPLVSGCPSRRGASQARLKRRVPPRLGACCAAMSFARAPVTTYLCVRRGALDGVGIWKLGTKDYI